MIFVMPRLLKVLTFGFASAITLWPFIIVHSQLLKDHKVLINHERIHLRQQIELLWIGFYFWYFLDYVSGRIMGFNHYQAYENIRFEREAYANENDFAYLQKRQFWSFLRY